MVKVLLSRELYPNNLEYKHGSLNMKPHLQCKQVKYRDLLLHIFNKRNRILFDTLINYFRTFTRAIFLKIDTSIR